MEYAVVYVFHCCKGLMEDRTVSQADVNNFYILIFWLLAYYFKCISFFNFLIFCLFIWSLVNLLEDKKKKLRGKPDISLSSSSEMGGSDNGKGVLFSPVKLKCEYWTSAKCCNLPVSPLVFSLLGPRHSLNCGAQPPPPNVLLYLWDLQPLFSHNKTKNLSHAELDVKQEIQIHKHAFWHSPEDIANRI